VIIPVLHEEETIRQTIESLFAQNKSDSVEVIVVDGDAAGSTLSAIEDDGLTKITSSLGRARQMNAGASAANGDVLLFLHADTVLPDNAFVEINRILKNEKVVAGAFDLSIDSQRRIYRLMAWAGSRRSRITRIPYGDQAIFIRRCIFEEIGGFKEIPIMEDVKLMQIIKQRGEKICISRKKVMTSSRRWEKEGVWFGIFRNLRLITLYSLGVDPEKLVKSYRPHCDP
jgi:rSAM/selenodomain-associated transferase 2